LADIVVSAKFPDPQSHSLCRPLNFGCSWSSTSTSFSGVTRNFLFFEFFVLLHNLYTFSRPIYHFEQVSHPIARAVQRYINPPAYLTPLPLLQHQLHPSFLPHTTTSKARSSLKVSHSHISGPSILYKPYPSFPVPTPQHLLPSSTSIFNFHLQLPSSTSIFNFHLQLPSPTSICNFHLQLQSSTSIFSLQQQQPLPHFFTCPSHSRTI
jgi:hypothetical protein